MGLVCLGLDYFMSEVYGLILSIYHMYNGFIIYVQYHSPSSVADHLGWFHFLAIVNTVAMDVAE